MKTYVLVSVMVCLNCYLFQLIEVDCYGPYKIIDYSAVSLMSHALIA